MISVILRNKLFLVSLWAIYPSFNIQHRLVFQQILNIFPQKDFWLWSFQMAFSRLFKNIFFPGRNREEKFNIISLQSNIDSSKRSLLSLFCFISIVFNSRKQTVELISVSRHSSDLRGQGRDLSFLKNAVVAGVRVRVRFDTYPTPNLKTAFFK